MIDDWAGDADSKVTVKKDELIAAVQKNRETHRSEFLRAQEDYRETVIAALDDALAAARNKKPFIREKLIELVPPQDHTSDYDRAIRMLTMSLADQIVISEHQFAQYVLDDWGWKAAWSMTNARYSKR